VALITRVKLKSGTVYELGKAWPVEDQAEGSQGLVKVGLIRLCPEDDDGDGVPAHYEIWCVPDALNTHFFNPVTRAIFKEDFTELAALKVNEQLIAADLAKFKVIRKRNIFLGAVACDDEDWPTLEALNEVQIANLDPLFAPPEPEESDSEEEEAPVVLQSQSNGPSASVPETPSS
jgi:hypothetical protein